MNKKFYYKELYKFAIKKIKSITNGVLPLFVLFIGLNVIAIFDANAANQGAPNTQSVGVILKGFRCAVDGYVGPILGFILVFVIMSLAYKVVMSGGGRPQDGSQGLSVTTLLTIGVALAVLMLAAGFSESILTAILPNGTAKTEVSLIFQDC
ncbi:MAG: hypothetical protein OEY79_04525 [Anaplasmataceae bacterium]|nr:hypothetical protein [Anaplasmataceae bacterium]